MLNPCMSKISSGAYDMGANPSIVLFPRCNTDNSCSVQMIEVHEGLPTGSTGLPFTRCGISNYFDGLVIDGFLLPPLGSSSV